MNEYLKKKYATVRAEVVSQLGGQCAKCGSAENLEIDHIDPKQKSFSVGAAMLHKRERLMKEIGKCQLLCEACHIDKTLVDKGFQKGKGLHGTAASYRYCTERCDSCKKANSEAQRAWRTATGANAKRNAQRKREREDRKNNPDKE